MRINLMLGHPRMHLVCHGCEASNPARLSGRAARGDATQLLTIWREIGNFLLRMRSALPRPRLIRFQMKKGSIWLWSATASGAVVVLSGILLWGDGSPQIPNGRATWGPSIWHLPDGLGLLLLVVVVCGVPWTAFLAFVGLALRLGPRAALCIAGLVLIALVLIL